MVVAQWVVRKLRFSLQPDGQGNLLPCLDVFGTPVDASADVASSPLELLAPRPLQGSGEPVKLELAGRFLFPHAKRKRDVPGLPGFGASEGGLSGAKLNAQTYALLARLALNEEKEEDTPLSWRDIDDRSWPDWDEVRTDRSKKERARSILGKTLVVRVGSADDPAWKLKPGIDVEIADDVRSWLAARKTSRGIVKGSSTDDTGGSTPTATFPTTGVDERQRPSAMTRHGELTAPTADALADKSHFRHRSAPSPLLYSTELSSYGSEAQPRNELLSLLSHLAPLIATPEARLLSEALGYAAFGGSLLELFYWPGLGPLTAHEVNSAFDPRVLPAGGQYALFRQTRRRLDPTIRRAISDYFRQEGRRHFENIGIRTYLREFEHDAWAVDFHRGKAESRGSGSRLRVRCVR
jgi:hypothetical protein